MRVLAAAICSLTLVAGLAAPADATRPNFPAEIELPGGYFPEGIAGAA